MRLKYGYCVHWWMKVWPEALEPNPVFPLRAKVQYLLIQGSWGNSWNITKVNKENWLCKEVNGTQRPVEWLSLAEHRAWDCSLPEQGRNLSSANSEWAMEGPCSLIYWLKEDRKYCAVAWAAGVSITSEIKGFWELALGFGVVVYEFAFPESCLCTDSKWLKFQFPPLFFPETLVKLLGSHSNPSLVRLPSVFFLLRITEVLNVLKDHCVVSILANEDTHLWGQSWVLPTPSGMWSWSWAGRKPCCPTCVCGLMSGPRWEWHYSGDTIN